KTCSAGVRNGCVCSAGILPAVLRASRPQSIVSDVYFRQSRQKTRLIPQRRRRVVIRMPPLPVRQNHHAWPLLAQHARDLQLVLNAPVTNTERSTPRDPQDPRRLRRLPLAVFRGTARPHLAPREIENAGAVTELRHLQQRAAAGLFYIVAMRRDRQNIEERH